jgi:hypothetical protein
MSNGGGAINGNSHPCELAVAEDTNDTVAEAYALFARDDLTGTAQYRRSLSYRAVWRPPIVKQRSASAATSRPDLTLRRYDVKQCPHITASGSGE